MSLFRCIHVAVEGTLDRVLERRPSVGYLVAVATGGSGALGFVDAATQVIGLATAILGLAIGVYTLRIQVRKLRRMQQEEKK